MRIGSVPQSQRIFLEIGTDALFTIRNEAEMEQGIVIAIKSPDPKLFLPL